MYVGMGTLLCICIQKTSIKLAHTHTHTHTDTKNAWSIIMGFTWSTSCHFDTFSRIDGMSGGGASILF